MFSAIHFLLFYFILRAVNHCVCSQLLAFIHSFIHIRLLNLDRTQANMNAYLLVETSKTAFKLC